MKKNNFLALVALLGGLSMASCGITPADASNNSESPSSSAGTSETPATSDSSVSDPNEGATIVTLFASVKEGIYFYNNGRANPSKEDFDVYAMLSNGSSLELTPSEFEMEVPTDFKTNGGTISFKVGEKSFPLPITLADYSIRDLSVSLKEERTFYKGQVKLSKDDLIVTAIFVDGVKKTLLETDYDLSFGKDFQYSGGEATIQTVDKKVSTKLDIKAVDVVLDHIEVAKMPGKTHYAVGDSFDPSLMEIRATLNNGVSRILKDDEYEIEAPSFIEVGNKSVKVSYTYSYVPNGYSSEKIDITKSTSLDVTISQTLENGNLISIESFTQPIIYDGDSLDKLNGSCNFYGKYSNGNILSINDSASITYPTGNAVFGEYASITVNCGEFNKEFPIKVSSKVECETSSNFKGAEIQNNALRNFNLVKNEGVENNFFELNYDAPFDLEGTLSFNMAPVSLQTAGDKTFMAGARLNTFMRLFVNDKEVPISDDSVMKQGEVGATPADWNFGSFYEQYQLVDVCDVALKKGTNKVRVELFPSTCGLKTRWDNNYWPSADFDYMLVSTAAKKLSDSDIVSLAIENEPSYEDFISKNVRVIATYSNGSQSVISSSKLNFECAGLDESSLALLEASISLKSNSNIKVSTQVRKSLTLEAEEATIVGGSKKEETVDGKTYNFAGGFNTNKSDENSVTFSFSSSGLTKADFTIYLSNGFSIGGYKTNNLYLADIMDISLNGSPLEDALTNVTLNGAKFTSDTQLFNTYVPVRLTLDGLQASNTLKIALKKSSKYPEGNYYHESPVCNIDKVVLDAPRYDINNIQSLSLASPSNYSPFNADPNWSEPMTVEGVLTNGEKVALNANDYKLTCNEKTNENGLLPYDKVLTFVASLKDKELSSNEISFDPTTLSTLKFSNTNFTTISGCAYEGENVAYVTKDSKIETKLPVLEEGTYELKLSISNGYIQMVTGEGKENGQWYEVKELFLSHIMDITIDEEAIGLSSVKLNGIEAANTTSPWNWYNNYQEVTITTKALTKGLHNLTIHFKEATNGETSQEWKNGELIEKGPHGNLRYVKLEKQS